jgi:hypothetical protein
MSLECYSRYAGSLPSFRSDTRLINASDFGIGRTKFFICGLEWCESGIGRVDVTLHVLSFFLRIEEYSLSVCADTLNYLLFFHLITSLSHFFDTMSLSRVQVLRATTTSPWTKDFRHLLPIPRRWTKRVTFKNPHIKVVAPQQRIKYWNIVPGDRIRVRGEPEGTIHEVLSINRLSNRVFLKGVVSVSF